MKTTMTAAAIAALAGAGTAQGAYVMEHVSAFGNMVYHLSGEPGLGSNSFSDSDSWPLGDPTPYPLSIHAAGSLPLTGGGSFYNAIVSANSTHRTDGVEGSMSQQYEWALSNAASGDMSSTVRTQAIFTVTGWSSWDLEAIFSQNGVIGNFVELKNEDTGDMIFFENAGNNVGASGVLGAGTYRFTARMLFNKSGSISNSSGLVQRQMSFDLTLSQVPAPGALAVLGAAGLVTRRRRG